MTLGTNSRTRIRVRAGQVCVLRRALQAKANEPTLFAELFQSDSED